MKVSIGSKIKDGPWGGGNLFVINLKNYLINNGHKVVHNLKDNDIDLILMTEPRKTSESSAFTHNDIEDYLRYINSDCLVVHRINECDERKDTDFVNEYLKESNKIADGTIFVSSWIKNLYKNIGIDMDNSRVILSGSNQEIFNNQNKNIWDKKTPLKLVTHHWGNNWNKGFDIYEQIDQLIDKKFSGYNIQFTYIGKLPENFEFQNTKHIKPISGEELAKEIKKSHIYVTGSINEPSGNHHIEGAQCGLPLLYINSGGIPEYCRGFGVMFDKENFTTKLEEIINNYEMYASKILNYERNAIKMAKEYETFFTEMLKNKSTFIQKRNIKERNNFLNFIKKYTFKIRSILS
tara:strand:- start:55830 stop:56879 length:1050 start_codon:yes stop_codon:yes gene_type:complete